MKNDIFNKRFLFSTCYILLVLYSCEQNESLQTNFQEKLKVVKLISDKAHNNGNEAFHFLPPLVKNPATSGVFDSTLNPSVVIYKLDNSQPTSPPLAILATTVSLTDEHYKANWDTDDFNLDLEVTYRIQIVIEDTPIGYADVDLVNKGKDLKNVDTDEYIPLVDGKTLRIKFRVEEDVLEKNDLDNDGFLSAVDCDDNNPSINPDVEEVCGNGIDDDCNGDVDENCVVQGLIAYYPFNANANDESGNGNDGIVNGATLALDRFGNANSAYSFDGLNDYIAAPEGYSNNQLEGTLSLWVKFVDENDDYNIVAKGEDNFRIQYSQSADDIYYSVNRDFPDETDYTDINRDWTKWFQLIVTWDGSNKSIYIDGQEVLRDSSPYGMVSSGDLLFGRNGGIGTNDYEFLKGRLDDIRFYNYPLSGVDILALYESEKPSVTPEPDGLIAYYPFNGNANDESGNANDGTVNGAVLTADRYGNLDSAYRFDDVGNKRISLGTIIDPAHMTNLTISAWINLNVDAVSCCDGDSQTILGQGSGTGSSSRYPFWFLFTYNGRYAIKRNSPSLETEPNFYPADDTWHFVTATVEGNEFALFFDGVEVSRRTDAGSPGGTNYPLSIGNLGDTSGIYGNTFNGDIDDVGIYNRALSPSEINYLYNQTSN